MEAATAHSQSIGLDLEAYRKLGLIWVVRRHDVLYLRSAFEGDELQAITWIDSARAATSIRRTLFLSAADEAPLVKAETTFALLTISTGKPARIPLQLMNRYGVAGA
jgi:acyl-CoA thioester hydrolase